MPIKLRCDDKTKIYTITTTTTTAKTSSTASATTHTKRDAMTKITEMMRGNVRPLLFNLCRHFICNQNEKQNLTTKKKKNTKNTKKIGKSQQMK